MLAVKKLIPQITRSALPISTAVLNGSVFQRSFATAEKITYIKDDDTYHNLKSGDKPCIMNFSASWCRPCKMIAPQFALLSGAYDHVNFAKIDIDNSPNIVMEEAVTSVPTYKLYKNNKLISQFAGADLNRLKQMIEEARSA